MEDGLLDIDDNLLTRYQRERKVLSHAEFSSLFPTEQRCEEHLEAVVSARSSQHSNAAEDLRKASVGHILAIAADSEISFLQWFHAFYLLATARFGLPLRFLESYLGLSTSEAKQIRMGFVECLSFHLSDTPFDGTAPVQIDETLCVCRDTNGEVCSVVVLGISDKRRVLAWPVRDRRSPTLIPIIDAYVDRCCEVFSDGWHGYRRLSHMGYEHRFVRHNRGQWMNAEGAHTFLIDSFWSYLKRMIKVGRGMPWRSDLEECLREARARFSFRNNPDDLLKNLLSI